MGSALILVFELMRSFWLLTLVNATGWKVPVFGFFLVRIFPHSDWTRRESILSSHFNIIWLCYAETYSLFCFSSNLDLLSIRMLGLSFPTWTGFIYRLDDYLKLFYMGWKFQLGLFKPWWNFTWLYRDYIFFRITAILFLHCFHLSCKMKCHCVVKLNFQPDLEAVNYHHKAPHLGCCGSPRSANDHFSTSNLTIPSLE